LVVGQTSLLPSRVEDVKTANPFLFTSGCLRLLPTTNDAFT
jgi:hypothetical protein